jgi:hypothetical protein
MIKITCNNYFSHPHTFNTATNFILVDIITFVGEMRHKKII